MVLDQSISDPAFLDGADGDAQALPVVSRPVRRRSATPGLAVLVRAAIVSLAVVAAGLLALPAVAEPGAAATPHLRGDVTARGDILTLADLVENAPAVLSSRPLFRAPALGATGTIQARRIVEAATALGVTGLETGGRLQIAVQRAARRVGPAEIEDALKRWLQGAHGLDPRAVSIRLDGDGPSLLAPVDLTAAVEPVDVTYDPRSRRIAGLAVLGERQASLRVSGVVTETRDVAVLARAINRGETLREADLVMERRPRDGLPSDAQASAIAVLGEVAQRALSAGSPLRSGDTAPPELVARGDTVAIVYEAPGISLSMRGLASDGGRLGAVINVVNTASKKVLQATVTGAGRVSVGPGAAPGPQLQASAAPR